MSTPVGQVKRIDAKFPWAQAGDGLIVPAETIQADKAEVFDFHVIHAEGIFKLQ